MGTTIKLILLFFVLLIGCSKSQSEQKIEYFNSKLDQVIDKNVISNSKAVIIIPNGGCTGCIDQAILFVRENIDKMNGTAVIFTAVKDRKLLKLTVGPELFENKKVFLDKNNIFANSLVLSNYPQYLRLDNGKVTEWTDNFQVNTLYKDFELGSN